MTTTAEVLDPATNSAIVKLSTRAFPGVLLQGDTLYILYEHVKEAQAVLDPQTQDEYYSLEIVADTMRRCLELYEATLARHGYSLPYFKR